VLVSFSPAERLHGTTVNQVESNRNQSKSTWNTEMSGLTWFNCETNHELMINPDKIIASGRQPPPWAGSLTPVDKAPFDLPRSTTMTNELWPMTNDLWPMTNDLWPMKVNYDQWFFNLWIKYDQPKWLPRLQWYNDFTTTKQGGYRMTTVLGATEA